VRDVVQCTQDGGSIGNVALHAVRPPWRARQLACHTVDVVGSIDESDACAFTQKCRANRASETTSTARDERDAIG
jgi:hypothetical protein